MGHGTSTARGRRTFARQIVVGQGRACFEQAAERLMTWQVHRDSGLGVDASGPRALPGTEVVLRLRLGPLSVAAPCVVVGVVAEATEQGFSYATLPGHPEDGVEHFCLSLDPDGSVRGSICAESAAVGVLARLGGPVTRWVQSVQTDRYLRAMTGVPARRHA